MMLDSHVGLIQALLAALFGLLIGGLAVSIFYRQKTELKNQRKEIQTLRVFAETDPLTGLLNRRAFEERSTHTLAQLGQELAALLLLDLDHFKKVNDTYGHSVGDQVLRLVAESLRHSLRREDLAARFYINQPARLGGEEFAVLLVGLPLDVAMKIAERIRQAVEALHTPAGVMTVSIGVATTTGRGPYLTELYKAADRGLYRAKDAGRNQVVVAS